MAECSKQRMGCKQGRELCRDVQTVFGWQQSFAIADVCRSCPTATLFCACPCLLAGINKSDVRFVFHNSLPKSLEGYLQVRAAGRPALLSAEWLPPKLGLGRKHHEHWCSMHAVWHGLHQSASKQQSSKPSCMCHAGERARWARRPAVHVHLVLHLRCEGRAPAVSSAPFPQNSVACPPGCPSALPTVALPPAPGCRTALVPGDAAKSRHMIRQSAQENGAPEEQVGLCRVGLGDANAAVQIWCMTIAATQAHSQSGHKLFTQCCAPPAGPVQHGVAQCHGERRPRHKPVQCTCAYDSVDLLGTAASHPHNPVATTNIPQPPPPPPLQINYCEEQVECRRVLMLAHFGEHSFTKVRHVGCV